MRTREKDRKERDVRQGPGKGCGMQILSKRVSSTAIKREGDLEKNGNTKEGGNLRRRQLMKIGREKR